jgi:hypothetical protein
MEYRRERDRILNWVLRAFLVLAIVGTVGGVCQFILSYKLYKEVAFLRDAHEQAEAERVSRRKDYDAFRSQLSAAVQIRDGEIALMRKQIDLLGRRRVWDGALHEAVRDRAKQK